ncbi:alpha/beta hydrolase-fold protein [Micrococcaceae bacterium Sec5.7]
MALFLHGVGGTTGWSLMVCTPTRSSPATSARAAPFAIAAVDGGNSWWHSRADGSDAQSMLLQEFVPLLAGMGFDTGRTAVFGLSIGGFGALLLASQHRVAGIRAVAAMSPAVWSQYDAGRQDNFDSAADFAANDVFALRPELELLPKRIDCGTGDNLLYSVRDYAKDLPGEHSGGFGQGGHDERYWRGILPDVISFLGKHLG